MPPDPGKQSGIFTAITPLNNDLTTFEDGYAPGNYDSKSTGEVTARYALQYSLNNATVELAQMVGYNNVAALGARGRHFNPRAALRRWRSAPTTPRRWRWPAPTPSSPMPE